MTTVEDQKQFERASNNARKAKVTARLSKAAQEGKLAHTSVGRTVTRQWTDGVAELLAQWYDEAMSKRPGKHVQAMRMVGQCSAHYLAETALSEALAGSMGKGQLTNIASAIGKRIEEHLQIELFKEHDPRAHKWVLGQFKKRKINDRIHKNAFMIQVMKHKLDGGNKDLAWDKWPLHLRVSIGLRLLEGVAKATGAFQIVSATYTHKGRLKTRRVVRFTETGMDQLRSAFNGELMVPARLPTIVPPADWDGVYGGGYYNAANAIVISSYRTYEGAESAHFNYLKDADLGTTTGALNVLQRTPYKINTKVLEVLNHCWDKQWEIGKLPPNVDIPLPAYPADGKKRKGKTPGNDAHKAWCKQARYVHETNASRRSKRLQVEAALHTAQSFAQRKEFYFPHQCDFRGRFYPMPFVLTPQGAEYVRALLMFAEGKPVNDHDAVNWHMVHGANTYGMDKGSMSDRVDWVKSHGDQILMVAQNPLDPASVEFWSQADKPFMFLAWCFDFWEVYNDRPSHIAVGMDGSCNGLQHFSAMLRDPTGAQAVNLEPSDLPQDIYQLVADRVNAALRKAKRQGGQERYWATEFLTAGVDRKTCKRSVMVMPYGGLLASTIIYVEEEMRAKMGPRIEDPVLAKGLIWLAQLVHTATRETVVAAKQAMEWLQEVADIASKSGKHLRWTTPSGFVANQRYTKRKISKHQAMGCEARTQFTLATPTSKLDSRASRNGISPNFVHSLDASALAETVVRSGLTSVHMVHDDYGTHAADAQHLATVLREVFVEMYADTNLLLDLKQQLEAQLPGVELPNPPEQMGFDVGKVMDSAYFFA